MLSNLEGRSKKRKDDKGKSRVQVANVEPPPSDSLEDQVGDLRAQMAVQGRTLNALVAMMERQTQPVRAPGGEPSGESGKELAAPTVGTWKLGKDSCVEALWAE